MLTQVNKKDNIYGTFICRCMFMFLVLIQTKDMKQTDAYTSNFNLGCAGCPNWDAIDMIII